MIYKRDLINYERVYQIKIHISFFITILTIFLPVSPMTYHKAFDPLTRSVLEGDVVAVKKYLPHLKQFLYRRLPYNMTLRHIAYEPYIDDLLLQAGVASLEHYRYLMKWKGGGYSMQEIARNPQDQDLYGKYPEDYSIAERKKIAQTMMQDCYVIPPGYKDRKPAFLVLPPDHFYQIKD